MDKLPERSTKRSCTLHKAYLLIDEESGDGWELRRRRKRRTVANDFFIFPNDWVVVLSDSNCYLSADGELYVTPFNFGSKPEAELALLRWLMARAS